MRRRIAESRRWVVKIGSSLLTDDGRGLDHDLIKNWCAEIATLVDQDMQIVLVSSGAIAEGINRLSWTSRPTEIDQLQAAAAVGQMGLVQAYESGFKGHGLGTAQVLLTHEDMANRQRYLNARATLRTLLKHDIVPVVNENDTVTTDEIRFGDNDTLGALVANLVDADVLVLLTDQRGLFDKDPRKNDDAVLLERADASDAALRNLAGPSGTAFGSGGMLTKVLAAEEAAKSGATTVIASGREPQVLTKIKYGDTIGTMLTSTKKVKAARKQWLSQLRPKGVLKLDPGACQQLTTKGASQLSVGVTGVDGQFQRGALVTCIDPSGNEIARGLVNYSSDESRKMRGLPSEQFQTVLGFIIEPELIHRDNLVLA